MKNSIGKLKEERAAKTAEIIKLQMTLRAKVFFSMVKIDFFDSFRKLSLVEFLSAKNQDCHKSEQA